MIAIPGPSVPTHSGRGLFSLWLVSRHHEGAPTYRAYAEDSILWLTPEPQHGPGGRGTKGLWGPRSPAFLRGPGQNGVAPRRVPGPLTPEGNPWSPSTQRGPRAPGARQRSLGPDPWQWPRNPWRLTTVPGPGSLTLAPEPLTLGAGLNG